MTLEVGKPCSFYHEGGHGDRRWVVGWRYGIICAVPQKGLRLGMVRIELPVALWSRNDVTGEYTRQPNERIWVEAQNVNEVGDTIFHGKSAVEQYEEKLEQKKKEQAAVDKKRAVRRFHR